MDKRDSILPARIVSKPCNSNLDVAIDKKESYQLPECCSLCCRYSSSRPRCSEGFPAGRIRVIQLGAITLPALKALGTSIAYQARVDRLAVPGFLLILMGKVEQSPVHWGEGAIPIQARSVQDEKSTRNPTWQLPAKSKLSDGGTTGMPVEMLLERRRDKPRIKSIWSGLRLPRFRL
jgi:hypothetical protein